MAKDPEKTEEEANPQDSESDEEREARIKGEQQVAREAVARGQALPGDRTVDQLPSE